MVLCEAANWSQLSAAELRHNLPHLDVPPDPPTQPLAARPRPASSPPTWLLQRRPCKRLMQWQPIWTGGWRSWGMPRLSRAGRWRASKHTGRRQGRPLHKWRRSQTRAQVGPVVACAGRFERRVAEDRLTRNAHHLSLAPTCCRQQSRGRAAWGHSPGRPPNRGRAGGCWAAGRMRSGSLKAAASLPCCPTLLPLSAPCSRATLSAGCEGVTMQHMCWVDSRRKG